MGYIDRFPGGYAPRESQKKIIRDIEGAASSGYKNVLLCAPTGVGKSHVAATVAAARGSSLIVTAQKILQDQYTGDFKWILPMKGMPNFPCLALYDPKSVDYATAASDPSVSCSKGNCSWEVSVNGVKRTKVCEHKPAVTEFEVHGRGTEREKVAHARPGGKEICYYYAQKYAALNASHAVFNYPAYFQTKKYSNGISSYLSRRCLVADEAHEIEDQVIDFIGHDIVRIHLRDAKMSFGDFRLDDVDGIASMADALAERYDALARRLEEAEARGAGGGDPNPLIGAYKARRDKMDATVREIRRDPGNMVHQAEKDQYGDVVSMSVKPIEVGRYVKEYFDYPFQLFMSATINKEMFCRTMGLDEADCALVEVERSPFPAESRTVRFHDVRRLNYRSSDSDYAAVYGKAKEIADSHPGEKGLILTTTKRHCNGVAERIGGRVAVAYEREGMGRDQVLRQHRNASGPSILASPSFWYGIDLKGDLSRFQIILKAPYLSMADHRTKVKAGRDPVWYSYAALVKLLQGMGRSVRSADDYAETHVLDEGARVLVNKMRRYVPRAYHDAFGWEAAEEPAGNGGRRSRIGRIL